MAQTRLILPYLPTYLTPNSSSLISSRVFHYLKVVKVILVDYVVQKPVPANILFLAARYAHYHGSPELLASLLLSAMDKINIKVERHQWDMTVLAF